jgi:hypothetical protein
MAQRQGRTQICGKAQARHDTKDAAHYGFISVTAPQLKRSMRQAQHLVNFAEEVLLRSGAE